MHTTDSDICTHGACTSSATGPEDPLGHMPAGDKPPCDPAPASEPRPASDDDGRITHLTYTRLFWIFMICSFVGLVVETVASYPIDGVWKNRAGFILEPLSPIYGLGALLLTLLFNRLGHAPDWLIFLVAAVFGAAFEYAVGWLWEEYFGIVAWSYADQPFSIGGHTSLGMALVWGIAGLLWTHALPHAVHLIDRVPRRLLVVLTVVCSVILYADIVTTLVGFSCWFDRQSGVEPQGFVAEFFAAHFGDEFMASHFQTMSMWTELANR